MSATTAKGVLEQARPDDLPPAAVGVQGQPDVALSLRGLGASYDGKPALADVTLDIPARRVTAIIGPSGCGKSTLLRAVNGLLAEEPGTEVSGTVLLGGHDTTGLSREQLRQRVGLVFQTPAPFPFSVRRNIEYVLRYRGIRDKARLERLVRESLEAVGLYDEVKDDLRKSALKLSGGQQQRLCIARALAADPEVLLLDEPCSALDVKSSAVIEDLLGDLKRRYTVVVVTHNIAQARRIADEVVFLYEGGLVEAGPSEAVLGHPRDPRTRDFLAGVFG